jgi:hypothetical protein
MRAPLFLWPRVAQEISLRPAAHRVERHRVDSDRCDRVRRGAFGLWARSLVFIAQSEACMTRELTTIALLLRSEAEPATTALVQNR